MKDMSTSMRDFRFQRLCRSLLTFLSGGAIDFSGSSGSKGGNAGVLNITVRDLLNTTAMNLTGIGGSSSGSYAGGKGGDIYLEYHGLIRKFTDEDHTPFIENTPHLEGGTGSSSGSNGILTYNKSMTCPRDADVTDDGYIDGNDVSGLKLKYNNVSTDSTYSSYYDINCDNDINVIDLSRIGFEYNTRN